MVFGMFSTQTSPIAVDFGSSSVKLLQLTTNETPSLVAAAELPIPDQIRSSPDEQFNYLARELPAALKLGGFKGRRAVCAVPSQQTIVQHMQILHMDGVRLDDLVKTQLQSQLGIAPGSVVVRTVEVCEMPRDGQTRTELICFAIPRETVMRYVELLRKCRLEVVGVHAESLAMVRAFDPIQRREQDDKLTTMYIDLGQTGTRVAIANGTKLTFSRTIQVGGQHFDQIIAGAMHCDPATARGHRLAQSDSSWTSLNHQAGAGAEASAESAALGRVGVAVGAVAGSSGGDGPSSTSGAGATVVDERRDDDSIHASIRRAVPPGNSKLELSGVDFSELMDTIADELSMCARYHRGLFPNRQIDRAILVGGEARQLWLCQHVARSLRTTARLGDPLNELVQVRPKATTPGLKLGQPQPGWAVACGLCFAPTDL